MSLLQNIVSFKGSVAKETYSFKEPNNCSHPTIELTFQKFENIPEVLQNGVHIFKFLKDQLTPKCTAENDNRADFWEMWIVCTCRSSRFTETITGENSQKSAVQSLHTVNLAASRLLRKDIFQYWYFSIKVFRAKGISQSRKSVSQYEKKVFLNTESRLLRNRISFTFQILVHLWLEVA